MFETKIHHGHELKKVSVKYFDSSNLDIIKQWRRRMSKEEALIPAIRDSIELAELAIHRWKARKGKDNYARSLDHISDFINDNPKCEVSNLVVLECGWHGSRVLSLCHFRRTWSNNIYIDYLAVHPLILNRISVAEGEEIRGVGRTMIQFLSEVAKKFNSDYIWGETTQNSNEFYRHIFGLNEAADLLLIRKEQYCAFLDIINEKLGK